MKPAAAGLLLLLLGALPVRAEPLEVLWDLRCEAASIAPGDRHSEWLTLSGVEPAARGESGFARVEDEAAFFLLLRERSKRRLEVTARGRGELFAHLGDVELGGRTLSKRWGTLSWNVPATATRPALNLLRLKRRPGPKQARPASDERYAVKEIRLTPASNCRRAARDVEATAPRRPLELAPGWIFIKRRAWSTPARLDLAMTTPWPETAVAIECVDGRAPRPLATVTGGRRQQAVERLALAGACGAGAGVALVGLGPDTATIARAEIVAGGGGGWRRRIDLAAFVATFLLAALGLALGRRVTRHRSYSAAAAPPWRDAALLVGIGLAARLAFIAFYPYPGHADDTWEYSMRAQLLADGAAAFWSDPSWHAWQNYSRPPGYFLFLALTMGRGDAGPFLAIGLQLLFSALAAAAVYAAARPLFGRTAALAAGALFALYLPSITTFSTLMTEPLYMLFLVPALAAAAWTATTGRRATALAAGALFGLAALVRSGPLVLTPIVGALLLPALGWRKGLRAAGWLMGAAVLTVLPWIVRNSIVAGEPAGVDDIVVPNLLQTHPNDRFVSLDGLDVETDEGWRAYYLRIRHANEDRSLSRQQGAILRSVLTGLVRDPERTARRFRDNVDGLLAPAPDENLRWILKDHHRVRLAWLTALGNAQYLFVLIAGIAGLLLTLRRRETWPLAGWLAASLLVVLVLFYPEPRFRLQTIPCLMVFAGAAIARVVDGREKPKAQGSPAAR